MGSGLESELGWLHTGSALVRSVLHLDPDKLTDPEWCYQVKMAAWAENRALQKLKEIKGSF